MSLGVWAVPLSDCVTSLSHIFLTCELLNLGAHTAMTLIRDNACNVWAQKEVLNERWPSQQQTHTAFGPPLPCPLEGGRGGPCAERARRRLPRRCRRRELRQRAPKPARAQGPVW